MKTTKGTAVPAILARALKADKQMLKTFEVMAPSCQREYAGYIAQAKKAETQVRRVENVLKHIAEWGGRHPARVEGKSASKRP